MYAELRNFMYWDSYSGTWITSVPTVPVAHNIGLACEAYNPTSYNQYYSLYFMITDPLGNYVDSWSSPYYLIKPEEGLWGNFSGGSAIPGNYSMFVAVNVQGYGSADTAVRTFALVTEALAYTGIFDSWEFWLPATQTWGRPSPTLVPLNSQIGIRCHGINKSASIAYMRFDIVKHTPDGGTETVQGSPKDIVPNGILTETFTWIGDLGGEYVVDVILYVGATLGTLAEVDRRGNLAVAFVQSYVNGVLPNGNGEVGEEGLLKNIQILYGTGLFAGDLYIPPVGGVTTAGWFKFSAEGCNQGPGSSSMGIRWEVTKPDQSVLVGDHMESFWTLEGNCQQFIHPALDAYGVDQVGEWSLKLELTRGLAETVVDTWQGIIFTAEEAPANLFSSIGDLIPALIMMMMMSIMMPMMEDPIGTIGKVGEKVEKVAGQVIQIILPKD